MLQVKILRCSARSIEGEINSFLQGIGSQPGFKVSVQDIKLLHLGGKNDIEEAMIIYNAVRVQPYDPTRPQPTNR